MDNYEGLKGLRTHLSGVVSVEAGQPMRLLDAKGSPECGH